MSSSSSSSFVSGLILGVGFMYFFDPRMGPRRRAIVRDKSQRAVREAEEAVRVGARDLANRAGGARAELHTMLHPTSDDDRKIGERVRAALGRVCSHAGGIDVSVHDGAVVLRGPVLASEHDEVLHRVAFVRGVRAIDDELVTHASAEGVPGLGAPHAHGRARWTPAALFTLGAASAGAGLLSMARGSALGMAASGLGVMASISGIEHRFRPTIARPGATVPKALAPESQGARPVGP